MTQGDRPLPAWFEDAKLGIFIHWVFRKRFLAGLVDSSITPSVGRALCAALLALAGGGAGCQGEPERPYPGHMEVLRDYERWTPEDLAWLERVAAASADPEKVFVVALAAYMSDPGEHWQRFVDTFPEERAMGFLFEQIEQSRLTPSYLYTFVELGRLAMQGDPGTIGRLLATTAHAEDEVAVALCDAVLQSFDFHTQSTLRRLGELPRPQRERVYRCFEWAPPHTQPIRRERLRQAGGAAPLVESELRKRLADEGDRES